MTLETALRTIATHLVAFTTGLLLALNLAGLAASHWPSPAPVPASCTFDGGGTIASGDAARTSEGRVFVCTDGTLIPVTGYGY